MAYDMRYPFVIPTLVYYYNSSVEERWVNRAATGVYLLSNWSKVLLRVVAESQRDSYNNCSDDKDIASCE